MIITSSDPFLAIALGATALTLIIFALDMVFEINDIYDQHIEFAGISAGVCALIGWIWYVIVLFANGVVS